MLGKPLPAWRWPPRKLGAASTLKLALMPWSRVSSAGVLTQWRDISGNGYHGTPTGSPAIIDTGVLGGVTLDGINDRIDGAIAMADQPCTLFVLHKANSVSPGAYAGIFELSDNGASDRSLWLNYAFGSLACRMKTDAIAYTDASTSIMLTRIDASDHSRSIWKNDAYKSSSGVKTTPARNVTAYRIGNRFNLDVAYHSGVLYMVLLYEGTPSEAALLALETKIMGMAGLTAPFSWPIQNATDTSGDPRLILRPTMDVLAGYPLHFEKDSVGYRDGKVDRAVTSNMTVSESLASRWEVIPTAGAHTFSVAEGAYSAATTVTARAVPTADPKKYVLAWGDSNASRGRTGWQEYIYTLWDSAQIEFLGTQGPTANYSTKNEGHDSWTFGPVAGAAGGFNQAGSPFWGGGAALDLATYEASLTHAPTHAIVCCGQNTAYLASEANLEAWLTTDLGHASTIFQAMEAQWPGIKIGVFQSWPLNADITSGWGSWSQRLVYRRKMHRLAERIPELITDNPGVAVSIIPTFAHIGIGVRPREPWGDAIHVSNTGHEQLITLVGGWLAAN